MRLHESRETYLEFLQATAAHIGIPAVHVEKDYWVTRVLKRLQESDYSEAVVFKGGTSLSKAHHLIQRFSEDIDLALMWEDGLSNSHPRSRWGRETSRTAHGTKSTPLATLRFGDNWGARRAGAAHGERIPPRPELSRMLDYIPGRR